VKRRITLDDDAEKALFAVGPRLPTEAPKGPVGARKALSVQLSDLMSNLEHENWCAGRRGEATNCACGLADRVEAVRAAWSVNATEARAMLQAMLETVHSLTDIIESGDWGMTDDTAHQIECTRDDLDAAVRKVLQ
jgi:hypothetical protein